MAPRETSVEFLYALYALYAPYAPYAPYALYALRVAAAGCTPLPSLRTHSLTTYYLLLTTYYLLAYYYLPRQVRELAPACRYRVRLRATNEQGVSAWSAAVAVETDAADSAHRIQFEQMQVHEALGEGGFSIVYRGVYGKQQDGTALQVALKQH